MEIKKQIENVKREYHSNKLKKTDILIEEQKEEQERNKTFKEYKDEYDKYKDKQKSLPKKGASREEFTLQLLSKFKQKLQSAKEKESEGDTELSNEALEKTDNPQMSNNDDDDMWLSHKLKFSSDDPILAKDANKKDDDWYEVFDPRNPLNKRRRGENSKKFTKK